MIGRQLLNRSGRLAAIAALTVVLASATALRVRGQEPGDSEGWHLPPCAAAEVNPIPPTPAAIAKGQEIFKAKCQRCHGASGKGNGPDADADHPPGNLTDGSRAGRNPDGVMFYKIWNGRAKPKMPAFKTDLSRDEIWTVILYAKTLRQPPAGRP
jgi:mono/diheme cytochrome c family protein